MNRKKSTKRKPTQADVAQLAGVSQTTVSHILNDSSLDEFSPETIQRVWDAINQLAYVPNRAAQSLRTSRTYTIAAIIPDITNPFYPAFARGIQNAAETHHYGLVLYNTDGNPDKEAQCLRIAHQSGVDGIIGVFFHQRVRNLKPYLDDNLPIVRFEPARRNVGGLPLDSLFVDNEAAAMVAVTHLIERGHQHIAMVTDDAGPGNMRLVGYRQALAQHGLEHEIIIESEDFTAQGGYLATSILLQYQPRPTAVFAANDLLAIGIMQAAHAANLNVPSDLAIVGFDDIPAAQYVTPRLTTIAQFQENLGKRAAEMLFEHLNATGNLGGRCEEMPFELKIRESS